MKANVRRFFAPTAKEVMRLVKEELGAHAVVLANRSVPGGVEMLVMDQPEAEKVIGPIASDPTPAKEAESDDFRITLSNSLQRRAAPEVPPPASGGLGPTSASVPPSPAAPVADQIAELRQLLEQQLAGFAWGEAVRKDPERAQLIGELLASGFSGALARTLLDVAHLPATAGAGCSLRQAVTSILQRQLRTLESEADLIDRGGIYALVGPTGVGKTTTTAKLAARCVVRHGADKVALITTDAYRIGAHDQLRTYGRILGVATYPVRDAEQLQSMLRDLAGKHMILIDTVGMSQRDKAVAEQLAMLSGVHAPVKRLVCLNASSRGDVLEQVLAAYAGSDLAGCILTKVDEAVSLAPVVDLVIRHSLRIYYLAVGQRVPEDLHLPNVQYLVHRAVKPMPANSVFRVDGDDAGLLMAADSAQLRIGGANG